MSNTHPTPYQQLQAQLLMAPRTWLITGVAGFIGSHLLHTLLKLNQHVVGLDNLSTGYHHNLDEVKTLLTPLQWGRFNFIEGDIRDLPDCHRACHSADHVVHLAALDSPKLSLADPIYCNDVNVSGFLNMLVAARDSRVKSFTYATTNAVYGDHPGRPHVEDSVGNPLSPLAVSKHTNELYAQVFARTYGFNSIGLRYFNVFGPRQNPHGDPAAAVHHWSTALFKGEPVEVEGDAETSRDFCYVANAVQATLLAATAAPPVRTAVPGAVPAPAATASASAHESPLNQVYNVATGERTSLHTLFGLLRDALAVQGIGSTAHPQYRTPTEPGLRHCQADVSKARQRLGYMPSHTLAQGLSETLAWASRSASPLGRERRWLAASFRATP